MLLFALASLPRAQGPAPATPLTLVAPGVRRQVPTTLLNGQELVALDDIAAIFQVAVREDTLAGGITVTYRGRTIVVSPNQPLASVNGRVVTLPSPFVRAGQRWLAPLEFLPRALGPIHDQPIELRRAARLLVVGGARVPRVSARLEATGTPTRATIDISPAAPVAIATEGSRVLLRVEADALELALPPSAGGLIEAFRAGDQPNTVAILLAPAAGPARAVATTADTATRVSIEVGPPAGADSAAAAPRSAPSPVDAPPPPLARAPLSTVVIDPGHGGTDAGVRGPGGAEEKRVTLEIAHRLRSRLETRLGVRVVLTRDDDRTIGPDERAAVANNSKADLFLSLHANAAPTADVAGAEVIHQQLDREGAAARQEAEADSIALPVLGGAVRTIDVLRWDLAQARHVERSAVFAAALEDELRRRVPMGPRPLQQAPMRVLVGANMPAALVEVGYLTNAAQERQAQSEEFQNAVADALFDGIVRFRRHLEEQPFR